MFRSISALDISDYSSVPVSTSVHSLVTPRDTIKKLFEREINPSSLTDTTKIIKLDLPTLQARYVLLIAETERVTSLNSALSQEVENYKNKLWKSEKEFTEQTQEIKYQNEGLHEKLSKYQVNNMSIL